MEDPPKLEPEDHGWKKENNEYVFKWFDGAQFPTSVKDVMLDSGDSEGNHVLHLFLL